MSVRYVLRSEGNCADTPDPEGRCGGMHCLDAVCLDISHLEGQCAAHFCLVRICMGWSCSVQHVH